jgi:hypothetical protein
MDNISTTGGTEQLAWLKIAGAVAAIVIPATAAINGYLELQVKREEIAHTLQLKEREIQSQIDLQFLNLALSKDSSPEDKWRVLDVLANHNT